MPSKNKWKIKIPIWKSVYKKKYSQRNVKLVENYKILLRKNEELRDTLCSLTGKINTTNMSIYLILFIDSRKYWSKFG